MLGLVCLGVHRAADFFISKLCRCRINLPLVVNHLTPQSPLFVPRHRQSIRYLAGLDGLQAVFRELKELTGTKERALAALSADGESQYSKVAPIFTTPVLSVVFCNFVPALSSVTFVRLVIVPFMSNSSLRSSKLSRPTCMPSLQLQQLC